VDVRIAVVQSPRELNLELPDDTSREDLRARIDATLADQSAVLWLSDKRGREVGVPVARIASIEIGPGEERRIGFGG